LPHPAKTAILCPDQIDMGNDEPITPGKIKKQKVKK